MSLYILLWVCGWVMNMSFFAILDKRIDVGCIIMSFLISFIAPLLFLVFLAEISNKVVWHSQMHAVKKGKK